jgi:hypothetical protein
MALTKVGKGGLDKGSIKDQTDLGGQAADTDRYLVYDASADELKYITAANVTPNETLITDKTELSAAASGDQVLIYDISAGVLKKVTQTNFLNFPTISSVSPTNALSGDGTGNYTFVITGSGFTGATASLVNASAVTVDFDSETIDSDTQITGVIAKSSLPNSGEPYDVKVTAASGLQSTLDNQINIDAQPAFSTASGSLGIFSDGARTGLSFTVAASDPESGGDVVYTLESGSIPAGLSFSSTSSGAVISGDADAVGSNTTSTFTIRAKDVNSNTSDRQFTITINAPATLSFTSSGTFSVPSGLTSVDVLVVAGGGGSGGWGGGGGAGGLIYRPAFPVTPGGTVTVTVGDGGAGVPGQQRGQDGQDSAFGTLTAKGGGEGGYHTVRGDPGGSGGGAGRDSNDGGQTATQPTQPGDSGTYGFGNAGGQVGPGGSHGGSGGGGAGGAGQQGAGPGISGFPDGDTSYPGPWSCGGIGKAYTIADGSTPVYYAGGGGGGVQRRPSAPSVAAGGQGGGGDGGTEVPAVNGQPGTANRGGGAGGGGQGSGPGDTGGSGGKGIVIVTY